MDLSTFLSFCLSLTGSREEFPFDEVTAAFKVRGKIFVLADTPEFRSINVKVGAEIGEKFRERYAADSPGQYMNQTHWITGELDGSGSRYKFA